MPLWRCPICDRRFAKPNQAHSCRPVSVDSHFEGKINLIPKHHMGGIRVLSQRLEVGFVLSRRIEHPRVRRAIEVGPSTYAQAVALAGHDDLDPELLGWLREAYERSARGWPFASHRVREHS